MENNTKDESREFLPILRNQMFVMACHYAVKNDGLFKSDKQKNHFLKIAKSGTNSLPEMLKKDIEKHILSTDLAILTFDGKRGNSAWCFAFILDKIGVRISFKHSCYREKKEKQNNYNNQENYHNTNLHRKEQIVAENRLYKICKAVEILFQRKEKNNE
jgi:hypothetical protein